MKTTFWEKNKRTICNLILVAVLVALVGCVDAFAPSSSMWFPVLRKVCTFALAAVAMNLLNGFTGLFSLGQAGFMLLGAYAYAILTIPWSCGAPCSATTATVWCSSRCRWCWRCWRQVWWPRSSHSSIGLPVLRLKSDYLAIATLGFAEIVRGLVQLSQFGPLTNGPDPLNNFTAPKSVMPYAAIAGVCILLIVLLINSTYGRAFKAIRDDEIAAEAMGINLARHKMISFVVSSFFCGVAGAMLAMCNTSVSSVSFTTSMTYQILLVVVVGGIGSVSGSVIAAFIYYASSEWWLRFLDLETYTASGARVPLLGYGFRMVVFSVLIMIVVLFFRKGIMGTREVSVYDDIRKIGRFFTRKSAAKGGDAQ